MESQYRPLEWIGKSLPVIILLAISNVLAQAQTSYNIIDLGSLPGNDTRAYGINSSGDVVGYSMSGNGCCSQAFFWNGNASYAANAPITYAKAINEKGVFAGDYDISGGAGCYETFLADAVNNITLQSQTVATYPGFDCAYAGGLNNISQFVGGMYGKTAMHAYLSSAGQMFDLHNPDLAGPWSIALGVNDATKTVGEYVLPGQTPTLWTGIRAFFSTGGQPFQDLNAFTILNGYDLRQASAINVHDRITGYAAGPVGNIIRAYLLDCGGQQCGNSYTLHDLGTLPNGGISYGRALNSAGAVAGAAYRDASGIGNNTATLFTHGLVVDLHARLSPADQQEWNLAEATGINDNGEVVGFGSKADLPGALRAFKLVPIAQVKAVCLNFGIFSVVIVTGTGFSPSNTVEVDVRNSDIGGNVITSLSAQTDASGAFVVASVVPALQDIAINAWDQGAGAYSNFVRVTS